jgi:hypothetical protein
MAAAPLINPTVASQGEMWVMLMQIIPSADAIGQNRMQGVQGNGRAYIRDTCGLHPCGDAQSGIRVRIGRLENENREFLAQ